MCCIALVGKEATMATTQLMRAVCYEVCWMRAEQDRVAAKAPRMNWVVVTDKNQNRRMQMRWEPSAGDR